MAAVELALVAAVVFMLAGPSTGAVPSYQERWYNQTLDHFRYTLPRRHFAARYLINDDHWTGAGKLSNGCRGPILFYTGNEGPITAFWAATGFMSEVLAPKWGALLVHAEERFYGESLPFGNESFAPANAAFLTTEQVLADYVQLISHLKATLDGAADCPVVAFGGSYGAKLTAYLRIKYPHIVVGGLAASCSIGYSAPHSWPSHGVSEYTWIDIVNAAYDMHAGCLDRVADAVRLIGAMAATAAGRAQLGTAFHLCSAPARAQDVLDWFTDAIETMPQMNYPYAVPPFKFGWPVNRTCAVLTSGSTSDLDLLSAAVAVTDAFYAYDGACLAGVGQGGIPGGGPTWKMKADPTDAAWGYQSCTETLHRFSGRGVRNFTFDLEAVKTVCREVYNVEPDALWPDIHFGGWAIMDGLTGASNIIFSQGLLDPWHGGGFLKQWDDSMPVLVMPNGAHHLDLRGPHPSDPADVTATRDKEERVIRSWIDAFAASR